MSWSDWGKEDVDVIDVSDYKPPKGILQQGDKIDLKFDVPIDELDIDFNRVANLSSFQRFLIEFIKQQFPNAFKSVDPRASKKVTAKEFNKRKQYMRDCMGEFQGLLNKRKELAEK